MSIVSRYRDQVKTERAHSPVCQNEGCNSSCSFAYSCFDQRMGRLGQIPWPVLALAAVAMAAAFV